MFLICFAVYTYQVILFSERKKRQKMYVIL